MSMKLDINATYISTLYPEEVKACTKETHTQDQAPIIASFTNQIIKSIAASLEKCTNSAWIRIKLNETYSRKFITTTEDLLRKIFKETLNVEMEESPTYKRAKSEDYSYNRFDNLETTLYWKREQENELRSLLGLKVPQATKKVKIEELRQKGTYSDFTFVVENKEFPVHKAILASSSDFFDALFSTGMKESTTSKPVQFGENSLKANVFEMLLTFIYTKEIDFSKVAPTDTLQLVHIAQETFQEELVTRCMAQLRLSITNETFYDIAHLAVQRDQKPLLASCKYYLSQHPELIEATEFSGMDAKDLVRFCEIACALGADELRQNANAFLTSRIGKEYFEEVCDAVRSSNLKSFTAPLKDQIYDFAIKNQSLLATAEMQNARDAYVALMTGLARSSKQKPLATEIS